MSQSQSRSERPTEAALLAELDWIRRLARALVADRDLAEDLVQETCAAALQHTAEPPARLRPWLAAVLHNVLRQHRRAADRRRFREALRARPESGEDTEAALERVRLQRRLVDRVLELDEPYRSTIVLRFFEDLPPREIARRAGVPVATVHSRLQRALAQLRGRLQREREDWALVLLPPGALVPTNLVPWTALMNTKATLAACSTLLLAAAWFWWGRAEPEAGTPSVVATMAELAPVPLEGPTFVEVPAEPAPEQRVAVRESVRAATPAAAPLPVASWTAEVRVLDARGAALVGVALRGSESPAVLCTSGAGGRAAFETRADHLALSSAAPDWVTVREGVVAHGREPAVVVVAPALDLAGSVRDQDGAPLAGAQVRFQLPEDFATRFAEGLESTQARRWVSFSARDGSFAFTDLPAVDGSSLTATLQGFESDELPAPGFARADLQLVLLRPRMPLVGALKGRVLDGGGAPVAEARVGLGLCSVLSDERGEFALPLARAVTAEVLTAVKAGYLPARLQRPAEPDGERSGWPDSVVLVLGGPPLGLRGVVLDDEDEPVVGAKVWLHDPTPAAPIGRLLTQLETLSAGVAVPAEALEQQQRMPAADGTQTWTEDDVAGPPSALWNWVATDSAGGFELGGLEPRPYRLDVLAPGSLAVHTSESFEPGGSTAVVHLGPPEVFERVDGRVVDANGVGVGAVQLFLMVAVIDTSGRVFGGTQRSILYERGGFAQSDEDGRFSFRDVPRRRAQILLRGEDVVPCTVDVSEAAPVIEIEQRCALEIVLRAPVERYDSFRLTDGAGHALQVLFLTHGSSDARASAPLADGRSGVVSASSRTREVRLFRNGVQLDTQAVFLVPGQVNRFEF